MHVIQEVFNNIIVIVWSQWQQYWTKTIGYGCRQNQAAIKGTNTLHVTQMLHTNYFINHSLIYDSPHKQSIPCQRVDPHVSKAHCGYIATLWTSQHSQSFSKCLTRVDIISSLRLPGVLLFTNMLSHMNHPKGCFLVVWMVTEWILWKGGKEKLKGICSLKCVLQYEIKGLFLNT